MAAPGLVPVLHVEAIQSVMPAAVTPPGKTRRVTVPAHLLGKLLRSRACVAAFYRRKGEVVEPWQALVGRLKESLNVALSEFPVLAGRVRRTEEGAEVKLSDSGVRLVQAEVEVCMEEFVGGRGEEALAYWGEVDEVDPSFSALCYVQATKFKGDGSYSVAISSSLLLADPSLLATFLKHWSRLHAAMTSLGRFSAIPIFDYARLKHPSRTPSSISSSPLRPPPAPTSTTLLFHAPATQNQIPVLLATANSCVGRAAEAVGEGAAAALAGLCVVAHGEEEVVVLEPCSDVRGGGGDECDHGVRTVGWEVMGAEGARFEEGMDVAAVRYRVELEGGGAAVVAVGGKPGLVCVMVPASLIQ